MACSRLVQRVLNLNQQLMQIRRICHLLHRRFQLQLGLVQVTLLPEGLGQQKPALFEVRLQTGDSESIFLAFGPHLQGCIAQRSVVQQSMIICCIAKAFSVDVNGCLVLFHDLLGPVHTFSSKGDALHIRRVALRQGPRCAVQIVADAAALVRRGRRTPARHGGEGGIEGRGARLEPLTVVVLAPSLVLQNLPRFVQLRGDLLAPALLAVGPLVRMKLAQLLVVALFDLRQSGIRGRK